MLGRHALQVHALRVTDPGIDGAIVTDPAGGRHFAKVPLAKAIASAHPPRSSVPSRARKAPPPKPVVYDSAAGFFDFRDRLADDLHQGRVSATPAAMVHHAVAAYGLGKAEAAEWAERFLADAKRLRPVLARRRTAVR